MKKFRTISWMLVIAMGLVSKAISSEHPIFTNNLSDAIALSEELDKDVLVIFTAEWCKYCNVMKNDIYKDEKIVKNLIVCYVDMDNEQELVKEYRVKTIPDMFILRKKIEIKRKKGYPSKISFINWLKND